MTTLTIADYLKFANLQMAAEAFIRDEKTNALASSGTDLITALIAGNNRSLKFTQPQADAFASQWEVLDQKANTTTGFSGTLFKAIKDDPANGIRKDDLVLSFRSTEFTDDHARDNKATNELEISEGGFALGQIADMEAWYAKLAADPDKLAGKTYTVTGYSLGGHLATAFNLLRQEELQAGPPPATLDQVITFNGAGVGKIGHGSLSAMLNRFRVLRQQAETSAGLSWMFATDKGQEIYAQLRADIQANGGLLTGAIRDRVATAFGTDRDSLLEQDYQLLLGSRGAVYRALTINDVANTVPNLSSGDTSLSPKRVADRDILAENIDYQLAILATRTEFATEVRSLAGGIVDLIASGGLDKLPGTPALPNQYDAVGWEYSSGNPVAVVAHSLWHHGTDAHLFIEDQPNWRGGIGLAGLSATLAAADVRLLVNGFSTKDFGDDHSLTLIIDSLNVQNTLLQLLPADQRATAAGTLITILKNASWRKAENGDLSIGNSQGQAEGDVLENVVNALADLFLGPQTKANRLNGNPDGNTWWSTSDSGGYSGRDKLYATLNAITGSESYQTLLAAGSPGLTLAAAGASLKDSARNDFGAFAALYSLSPFVLGTGSAAQAVLFETSPLYALWKADRDAWANGMPAESWPRSATPGSPTEPSSCSARAGSMGRTSIRKTPATSRKIATIPI
ncbi:hypothetical protein [Sulfuritalea sp.]|uniref:hypothetical protein n=1 Tax=Sulfuritalea sp. TaxID=2480090 RepID=UPI00286E80F3|nr:hypothetical protein [Sulfuritalea sp.]